MAKRYTGLNLAQTQPEDTIDFTGLGKGILAAEEFKYKEREKKKDQALELLKPQTTFHPYQAAADETLKGIYDGLLSKKDVDPLEVSRAAIEYNQQISLAKAVGESISGITQQYYQDPELNADVAAQMLKSKYIKDGSLPELYRISNQTLDGSFFLQEQGGSAALNVPLTLSNRLKTIGEITKKITTSGDWKKIPGLTGLAESEVLTRMTQAANIVDVDANGNPYIKDINSPQADTAIGAMLTDQRVSRIVDDALALAGIQQPTYDQRKEELRRQLAPYASYTATQEQKKATTSYQTWDPRKVYPGPSGPGADYVANFQANILSGNTALIKDAVNYIRVAPDFNINSLPDQLATISLKDASGVPVLQNANDKSVILNEISGSNVEVIDAKAEQGDPKLGLDPNQLYVKITIKGPPPFLEKFNWAKENIDFHLPIEAFKNQTFTNFLYNAAKAGQGKEYGVLPSTVNVNQVYAPPGGFPQMALGGEIDVDTKYSDFKGTATVKDLIGGFSMGGYVSTSVRDLMKKGFNEGGTLPEYSAQAEEVTVTAEAPAWLKFKRDFLKENPFNISQYVEERVNQPQTGRAAYQAIDEQELRSKIRDQGKRQYEGKMYDYIQKKLVEVNPQAGRPRGEWLDSFSEKEQKILKQSPRFQPTYITDFKRSLQTAIEQNPTDAFRFIMDSKDYTTQEKKDMILSHIENPAIAKLADAAGIFAPLSMGSKVIQSTYRDDTTIESALMGIKNDASIIEDLITDVTTFIGPGTAAKIKNLMRIGKTKEAAKVIAQVADKLPAEAVEFIDDFAVKSQSAPMQPPVQAAPIEQVAATEEVAKVVDEAVVKKKEMTLPEAGQVADKLPKEATEFVDDFVEATGQAEMKSMKKPEVVSPELSEQAIQTSSRKISTAAKQEVPIEIKKGLHIKSTMSGSPLEKQVNKKGQIAVNNINNYIKKQDVPANDKEIIKRVLDSKFKDQKSINYNEFVDAVQDELADFELRPDFDLTRYYSSVTEKFLENSYLYKPNFNNQWTPPQKPTGVKLKTGYTAREFTSERILIMDEIVSSFDDFLNSSKNWSEFNERIDEVLLRISDLRPADFVDFPAREVKKTVDYLDELSSHYKKIRSSYKKQKDYELGDMLFLPSGSSSKMPSSKDHFFQNPFAHLRYFVKDDVFHAIEIQSDAMNSNYKIAGTGVESAGLKIKNYEPRVLQETAKVIPQKTIRIPADRETISRIELWNVEGIDFGHGMVEPIEKRYTNYMPKYIKEAFGVEPKKVTDEVGNTWWEFDIPEDFRKKGQIKALGSMPLAPIIYSSKTKDNEPNR